MKPTAAKSSGAAAPAPRPPASFVELEGGGNTPSTEGAVDEAFLARQGADITRASGSSFVLSFLSLGPERRRGMEVFYAFCRAVDDAVDDAPNRATAAAGLAFWRDEVERIERAETPRSELGRELAWVVGRFGLRVDRLQAIVTGCEMDLDPAPYADAAALDRYCWHVASAVGLCCLPIFGAVAEGGDADAAAANRAAEDYAEKLGLALQWTNILRDLRVDALGGRVYVPARDLAEHGVEASWLKGDGPAEAYVDGGPVHRLVDALAARARRRFAEARAVKPRRFRHALIPAEIMGAVYRDLLVRVGARRGRITDPLPRVPKLARVRHLVGVLARTWLLGR
jgi:phytoene synthase